MHLNPYYLPEAFAKGRQRCCISNTGFVLRTAEVPHGLVLAGPRRCLHKFIRDTLHAKSCFFWLRSFPRPEAALSSDSTQSLRCFSTQFTATSFRKKAGITESSFSPLSRPLPGFGKQVHVHSRLAGDGSGDLRWDMKHFSQRLLALHRLSRGPAAASVERADNCGSGGRGLSTSARLYLH